MEEVEYKFGLEGQLGFEKKEGFSREGEGREKVQKDRGRIECGM